VKLGTRGSRLATTQSQWVADAVTALTGEVVELTIIRTEGDNTAIPLDAPSRPGAFVATLRDALLEGRVDLAVHSFKDLPSAQPNGLVIAAVPQGEDPRDVLVSRDGLGLDDLPEGARVGTSSPRRAAALLRVRPDLEIIPVRGNVDTRISFVTQGRVDAVVLAAAGITRLGRADEITHHLPTDVLLPAPAQGALAVECRTDSDLAERLAALDDRTTRLRARAERAVLRGVDAACTTALGAHAELDGDHLSLVAEVTNHRGVAFARVADDVVLDGADDCAAADQLGLRVADALRQPR